MRGKKLNPEEVLKKAWEIFEKQQSSAPIYELGEHFKVHPETIGRCLRLLRKQNHQVPDFRREYKPGLPSNEEILRLLKSARSITSLAKRLGVSRAWLRSRLNHLRQKGLEVPPIDGRYTQAIPELQTKIYSDFLRLRGDWVISSDYHLPFVDRDLVSKMIKIARRLRVRNLLIAGDFLDCETISKYPDAGSGIKLKDEISYSKDFLKILEANFDQIVWFFGNHDNRIIRALNRLHDLVVAERTTRETAEVFTGIPPERLDAFEFAKNLFESEKLTLSRYPYCEINDTWRITHPKSYSRVPPFVEERLAIKWRKSVLGTHGHLFGIRTEPSGHDIGVQIGCLADPNKIRYLNENETTHPRWTRGFAVIRNNAIYFFAANPRLTDWDFWLEKTE